MVCMFLQQSLCRSVCRSLYRDRTAPAPLFNEHQQPVGRFGRCWWSLKRVHTYHHTPSPTSTQQHPPFILKPTSGTGFCEKRYHPLDAPLTPNPPSPRLVKVDEAICKCPSRAKKGTTHACLSRACHYSTLIHLGEGWPGIKNMDHWWYLFSQKPERKISAFL